ncbi:MAG: hypothetical protein NZ693_00350 [Thermoflexales bacterium]|nr:hypothetical protein [Thermoflexales bacterium]
MDLILTLASISNRDRAYLLLFVLLLIAVSSVMYQIKSHTYPFFVISFIVVLCIKAYLVYRILRFGVFSVWMPFFISTTILIATSIFIGWLAQIMELTIATFFDDSMIIMLISYSAAVGILEDMRTEENRGERERLFIIVFILVACVLSSSVMGLIMPLPSKVPIPATPAVWRSISRTLENEPYYYIPLILGFVFYQTIARQAFEYVQGRQAQGTSSS